MKLSRYKDIIDSLGRYASNRPKAEMPVAAIGVQSDGQTLKLISGTETAGMIVSVPEATVDGKFIYYIDARSLLQSKDVLPSKDEVEVAANKDGLEIKSSSGGVLVCKNEGSVANVGFPKKPKAEVIASGGVDSRLWGQLSRIVPDVSAKVERPSIHTGGSKIHISIVSPGKRPRYAAVSIDSTDSVDDSIVTELDWYEGLRALQHDGTVAIHNDGLVASDGSNEVYTTVLQRDFSWPVLGFNRDADNTWFTMDRSKLTSAIRGQSSEDEFNRITIRVDKGQVVFSPFNKNGGLTLPATTGGPSNSKSLNADYLKKTLATMIDSKHVTMMWGDAPAISVSAVEYEHWTILIAPVALG